MDRIPSIYHILSVQCLLANSDSSRRDSTSVIETETFFICTILLYWIGVCYKPSHKEPFAIKITSKSYLSRMKNLCDTDPALTE